MTVTPEDRRYMAAAIRLSRQHTGLTSTNPSVGCILVKDGVVLGSAVTARGGRPHAETQALAIAGDSARGATAYVTLEPCSHWGKTPPCANALVAAGVARVVVCLTDPDPRVSGRGLTILRDAGIEVVSGVLQEDGRQALEAYLMRQMKGRPHVTLKLAVSADGMIGREGAGQVAITGPASRAQVHALRAEMDAILVGIGTAIADDPELTVRLPGLEDRSPIRIVLDRHLRLPLTSKLVRTARDVPVLVAVLPEPPSALPGISPTRGETGPRLAPHSLLGTDIASSTASLSAGQDGASFVSPLVGEMPGRAEGDLVSPSSEIAEDLATRRNALIEAGVEILDAADLPDLLAQLATRGLSSLLVEGGASVARAFLEAGLVDRILLFEGETVIGEGGIESPLTAHDIPKDYKPVRRMRFGADSCCDYEREFECLRVS
ncbi:bifunctional diaminohydroxyphosphoribosylaminopyrimidine deaminase/5-amino-6-(5-phosphoribosylamino)uracil reductase RibD [Rhizobium sp. SL86]|uniref:bifunctional diaminohydroxyphosphoribosylaminopyrimidine deaminase/5-amino-6-(5-phosphoribosylamino)uracil reductase RibD n=1 Tax=Rhizobium sp. SL86 TaxID=2995148 RepID=UPI002275A4A7|nr:bifunctional diaminohydroxyphosphoribosylaminopyrimidine deaminase/5-amino-6-(5-phosphoribosylamino)uracil reductase RibD [Rhizobium sp. SL86]MCY1663949.1 bifunctional diaminohydroxyphosphoribosylaminopyrimidine deaminase/5-amino-6-(5-phosphoribosylamino)uracil reductase RibD [Rhizobium sp. SL86]